MSTTSIDDLLSNTLHKGDSLETRLTESPEMNSAYEKVLVATNQETRPAKNLDEDIRYGLKWNEGLFDLRPSWTVVPDINVVAEICQSFAVAHLPFCKPNDVKVKEKAQGAFNRVFQVKAKIRCPSSLEEQANTGYTGSTKTYIFAFRVSLPVNPQSKTMSESATLAYLKKNTTIPVPNVLAFDASNGKENRLRFEWMLETFMPGEPLDVMFDKIGNAGRQYMVQQLVDFQAEIFELQHDRIGSLYKTDLPGSDPEVVNQSVSIGEIGTIPFFLRDRLKIKSVNRGPFCSSIDWLNAQLSIVLCESRQHLEQVQNQKRTNMDKPKDEETFPKIRHVYSNRTLEEYHIVDINNDDADAEDSSGKTNGEYKISEDKDDENDKDRNNDEEDEDDDEDDYEDYLEDIQDTQCLVSRLLQLLPTFFPETGVGLPERTIMFHPDLSLRNILVDKQGTITAILDWENTACLPLWAACDLPSFLRAKPWYSLPDPKDYRRGEKEDLYQDRLVRYRLNEIRELFLSRMKEKCPLWIETYKNSRAQRDLRRAIELCDHGPAFKSINHWLDIYLCNGLSRDPNIYVPLEL